MILTTAKPDACYIVQSQSLSDSQNNILVLQWSWFSIRRCYTILVHIIVKIERDDRNWHNSMHISIWCIHTCMAYTIESQHETLWCLYWHINRERHFQNLHNTIQYQYFPNNTNVQYLIDILMIFIVFQQRNFVLSSIVNFKNWLKNDDLPWCWDWLSGWE